MSSSFVSWNAHPQLILDSYSYLISHCCAMKGSCVALTFEKHILLSEDLSIASVLHRPTVAFETSGEEDSSAVPRLAALHGKVPHRLVLDRVRKVAALAQRVREASASCIRTRRLRCAQSFGRCLTVDVASVVWDLFLLDGEAGTLARHATACK